MKEIQLTQEKFSIIDDGDFERVSKLKWCAQYLKKRNKWVAVRGEGKGKDRKILALSRFIVNAPDGLCVDHINGDTLDNRRKNLRICTNAENGRNRGKNKNNISGYKGVTWDKTWEKYKASIIVNRVKISLGTFSDPVKAARAYDEAAKKHHGEFAYLNFPD